MIKIAINGENWELAPQTSVSNLLSRLKVSPKVCVIEINGEIVPRRDFQRRTLINGDRVEVIRLMAGG